MNAVGSVSGPLVARGAASAGKAGVAPPLLPSPAMDSAGLAGVEDALLILYADRVKQGAIEIRSGEVEVARNRKASEVEQKRAAEARERQREAEKASKGFWGFLKKVASTIAKIATTVASAAAAVVTGGALGAVAIAAVALSVGGTAVKELKLLGKLSDKIGIAMELGGAALSVGGTVASAFKATEEVGKTALELTLKKAERGAQIAFGAATATGAAASVKVAGYERDRDLAAVDVEAANGAMARFQRETRWILEALRSAKEAEAEDLRTIMATIEGCNRAAAVAIAGVRG
ncbi:MAG: hypothetical protein KF819_25180 [Labilithrix sp.]|nr:hypothetical protein [Labilithrix sp.]